MAHPVYAASACARLRTVSTVMSSSCPNSFAASEEILLVLVAPQREPQRSANLLHALGTQPCHTLTEPIL